MPFLAHYSAQRKHLGFHFDEKQQSVATSLNELLIQIESHKAEPQSLLNTLKRKLLRGRPKVRGCYIWGSVGRGKTWLMDLFYQQISQKNKLRLHYQEFMQQIHLSLTQEKGRKNPLKLIAKRFADRWPIICLDEFSVTDITDAMLLHGMLKELNQLGVIMVMTSNHHPNDLYKNGLQRTRFVSAIELINREMNVLELGGNTDFRKTHIDKNPIEDIFKDLGAGIQQSQKLLINKRYINAHKIKGKVVWFCFDQICSGPRSPSDYIELANLFRTVCISDVPVLNEENDDKALRFIHFIDEMYDRRVEIIISAQRPPESLYQGRRFMFEFNRTASRLAQCRYILALPKAV